LATQKPVAAPGENGELVIRSRPTLEFNQDQVALALAVTYGAPRPKVGWTNISTALNELVRMALAGEDVTASDSIVAAWRMQLERWEVWPPHD
jgi:hypothetical protein